MWKYVSFVVAGIAILAMVHLRVQRDLDRDAKPPAATVVAPAWELRDVDGLAVSSTRFLGKVVKDFMEQFGMNYPVVMGDENVTRAFGGIEALPTTFVINREGWLVSIHVGYADKQSFENEIKPLL